LAGAALGASLKIASEQDERDDYSGGLVVHKGGPGREDRRKKVETTE